MMPASAATAAARLHGTVRHARLRSRVRLGELWIDSLTFAEALDEIASLVRAGRGGSVFTPNVDHVMLAETHSGLREAYQRASLALVDGMPLLWASRLLGTPLPEKVSGSDLIMPLAALAAARGWGVYLLGGAPGVAEEAAARLRRFCGVRIVGCDAPQISADGSCEADRLVIERIRRAAPQIVMVALGAPKQELWIRRVLPQLRPAVLVGIGASLDFVAGRVRRAPRWMSSLGLEWLYRLAQEPRRLWRRYLVRDPMFLLVALRMRRLARRERVRVAEGAAR
jgi:N-acetylglucosaminyldiphosphoundecaprenol N-acetyl-beta-D-mannosaminyltransferase